MLDITKCVSYKLTMLLLPSFPCINDLISISAGRSVVYLFYQSILVWVGKNKIYTGLYYYIITIPLDILVDLLIRQGSYFNNKWSSVSQPPPTLTITCSLSTCKKKIHLLTNWRANLLHSSDRCVYKASQCACKLFCYNIKICILTITIMTLTGMVFSCT